jgi:predicted dehydrogenase
VTEQIDLKRGNIMTRHILIVGTGSAGKRHAKNLHALGCEISCMDPRQDRLDEIGAEEINLKTVFTSLEDAFAAEDRFDAVVVASPPSFHVDQCISALQQGVPVLLEKPVSPDLTGALKLQSAVKDTAVPLLLGYGLYLEMVAAAIKSQNAGRSAGCRAIEACQIYHGRASGGLASLGTLSGFFYGQQDTGRRCDPG